jgi:hypothetical protein
LFPAKRENGENGDASGVAKIPVEPRRRENVIIQRRNGKFQPPERRKFPRFSRKKRRAFSPIPSILPILSKKRFSRRRPCVFEVNRVGSP